MNVAFTIDKKAMQDFEVFMTQELQTKVEKAYAQTLKTLASGCVTTMRRRLGKSPDADDRALAGSGISFAPRTVKGISRLNPLRVAIGAESGRKRNFLEATLVGRPFRVNITTKRGRFGLIAQRNARTKHVDAETASSPQRIKGTSIVYQSHQSFDGYRNTALPITIISSVKLNQKQTLRFKALTLDYAEKNHDRILSRFMKKAMDRG